MKKFLLITMVLVAPLAWAGPRKWAREEVKARIQAGSVDAIQYDSCLRTYCRGNRASCMVSCARFAAVPQNTEVGISNSVSNIVANNPYAAFSQPPVPCNTPTPYVYTSSNDPIYGSTVPQMMGYGWNAQYSYYGAAPATGASSGGTGTWSNASSAAANPNDVNSNNPYSFETGTFGNNP
jgi:hypothetical protein